jgi:hypothetical protein
VLARHRGGIEPATGAGPGGRGWSLAGPAGSTTVILTPSGCTPERRLDGVARLADQRRGIFPREQDGETDLALGVTTRSRIMPAESRSLSSRGFLMRASAAPTCAWRDSAQIASTCFDLGNHLAQPGFDAWRSVIDWRCTPSRCRPVGAAARRRIRRSPRSPPCPRWEAMYGRRVIEGLLRCVRVMLGSWRK